MGLDLFHIKLTLTPTDDYYLIDDWDIDCNVPIENYSEFITDVKLCDFSKTIAIVDNESDLEKLQKVDWFTQSKFIKVFIGSKNEKTQNDIAQFVKDEKLDKLETSAIGVEQEGVKFYSVSFGEQTTKKGVYNYEVGYQRKGMNKQFHDTFKKYELWGKKEDFDLAYSCVGGEWYIQAWGEDAVMKMRKEFKENFTDNYVFGQSLLIASF